MGLGGDWFDAISLGDDNLCLVVGDVTGHGVGAVAAMTQVRTVVHTLVAGGMALPDVLVRTSDAMRRDGLGYATMVIAVVGAQGHARLRSAGHPPPLVRRPGGTVDVLTGGRHSVLGIDLEPRPPGNLVLPAGATLVAYTDGLIERRDRTIDAAVAMLADDLRAAPDHSSDGWPTTCWPGARSRTPLSTTSPSSSLDGCAEAGHRRPQHLTSDGPSVPASPTGRAPATIPQGRTAPDVPVGVRSGRGSPDRPRPQPWPSPRGRRWPRRR